MYTDYNEGMRKILALVISYLAIIGTAQGQTATPAPFVYTPNAAYEFENTTANMSYSGTWSTINLNASSFRRGSNGASVSFWVRGGYLMIYRTIDPSFSGSIQVCVSVTCNTYSSNYPIGETAPIIVGLPDSTNNYQITLTGNYDYMYLDYFVLLSEAAFPTPLPTATPINTPLPTPTPISTWTPGPSITPQPSSTPMGVVWAIDPACQYGTTETGQITCTNHSATAGDISIFLVLTVLTLSGLGMFFLVLFGFVEGRRK